MKGDRYMWEEETEGQKRKSEELYEKDLKRRKSAKIWGWIGLGLLGIVLAVVIVYKIDQKLNPRNCEMKPVIYLYPEETTKVQVRLDHVGELTTTYPAYKDGWTVTAEPDGSLTDADGKEYNYLYWEGEDNVRYEFAEGFCVKGSDTAAFLEDSLEKLGLTRREANEFIVYWLPLMEKNEYNVITFQTDAYTEAAKLEIAPKPDTLIRVFMTWYASKKPVEIPTQTLCAPEREGFTVVEWGGANVER